MARATTDAGDTRPPRTIEYPGQTRRWLIHRGTRFGGWRGNGLPTGRRALISGGDTGSGRAMGIVFAMEGAKARPPT